MYVKAAKMRFDPFGKFIGTARTRADNVAQQCSEDPSILITYVTTTLPAYLLPLCYLVGR